jgi:hypothetical protein
MSDGYALLVAQLDPQYERPLLWSEAGRYGNEQSAIRAAAAARTNGTVARIFHETDHELERLLAESAAARNAPVTLYGIVIQDPTTGTRGCLHEQSGWMTSRAEAEAWLERLTPVLNAYVVTADGCRG